MRTQRSARSHGRLLVAVVLTVGVAGVGPAWATGMDPLGDVTETVQQVTGPVDDVVDQGPRAGGEGRGSGPRAGGEGRGSGPRAGGEGRGPQVPERVEGTVDQATGAVDDTAEAAAGAGQETTPGAGGSGGRGVEEGSGAKSGGSKDREGQERPGTSPEHGDVSKRSAETLEASSPGLAREGWYQGTPDVVASQVRAASGPCPNGIDEACLLDALYDEAGAGAAEVLGIRRLATTGLGLLALAMIALLAAGSGGALLTWSGRRERRRAV